MKNQIKNLSKTLIASAALTLAAGSAFANLDVQGSVLPSTCALGVFSTTAAATEATITLPNITTAQLKNAVGGITTVGLNTAFYVKPTNRSCTSTGTTFNVNFYATSVDTNVNTRVANSGTATGVTTDLIQTNLVSSGVGMTIGTAATTAATQHGVAAAIILSGSLAFSVRYYKTTTATAGVGTVITSYILNNEYP